MRSRGKGSIAAVVGVALDGTWCGGLVVGAGILVGTLTLGLYRPQLFLFSRSGLLMLQSEFLSMGFSQAAVKNPQAIVLGASSLTLLTLGIGLAIIRQLRMVLATVRRGTPFTVENAGRIRKIGRLTILGSLLQSVAAAVMGRVMLQSLSIKGVALSARNGLQLDGVFIGWSSWSWPKSSGTAPRSRGNRI